ncbi:MAG TPA: collagen-like protein [Candidatus Saccharimonadales bacterium]|nr:collagen-like protein [Candidatus Saccharimonadales bacterium]
MKQHFLPIKQSLLYILVGLFTTLSLVVSFPGTVQAAGETYTYKDTNNITMTGANLQGGSFNLKRQSGVSSNLFQGGGEYKNGGNTCGLGIGLRVSEDGKQGVLSALPLTDAGGAFAGCGNAVLNQYNGKTVSIAGDAGNNPDQTQFAVLAEIAKTAGNAPAKLTFTLKDQNDKVLVTMPTDRVLDNGTYVYSTNFVSLAGGTTYKVCAGEPFNSCQSKKAIANQSILVTFGQSAEGGTVFVEIHIKGVRSSGEAFKLGPVDVTMQISSGGPVTTVQTNSQDVKALEAGASALGDYTGRLDAKFTNAEGGQKYQICVPVINACKTFTKNEANADTAVFNSNDLDKFQDPDKVAKPTCDLGFWVLDYFGCPLAEGAATATNKFDTLINDKLTVDVDSIFDTKKTPGSNYKAIEDIFRTIALSIIVIMGILAVAGETIGVGVFASIAIRSALPRLIAMAFIIVIWWPAAETVVLFINNVGTWIGDLLLRPFIETGFFEGNNNPTLLGSLAQTGALIGALVFLGPFGALMAVGLVFVAYAVAYAVLTIWGWLVVFFIIIGPVFAALGALKTADKPFQWYITNVSELGLVALAAPALIALGKIGGALGKTASGDAAGLSQILGAIFALMAIMALFFNRKGLLGTAVQKVGGAGRNFVARRQAGLMKRGSKRMQEKGQKYGEKFENGTLAPSWMGKTGAKINSTARGLAAARKAGVNPVYAKKQWEQAKSQHSIQRSNAILQSKEWGNMKNDDDVAYAATQENEGQAINNLTKRMMVRDNLSESAARSKAVEKVAALRSGGFQIGDHGLRMAGFKQMAANGSAFGYGNVKGFEDAASISNQVAENTTERAELAGALKASAAARPDVGGASFGTILTTLEKAANGTVTHQDFVSARVESARNNAAHSLLQSKERAIKEITESLNEDAQFHVNAVNNPTADMTPDQIKMHHRKALENDAIQKRLSMSGTYAGMANVAAHYDVANQNAIDIQNRQVVQQNIALGTPSTTRQVFTEEHFAGPAGPAGPSGATGPAGSAPTGPSPTFTPGTPPGPAPVSPALAGKIGASTPPTPGTPPGPTPTGRRFVSETENVPNKNFREDSLLNEEVARHSALVGMPQQNNNLRDHELRTGGGS